MAQMSLKLLSSGPPIAKRQAVSGRHMPFPPMSYFYELQLNGPTPDRVRVKLEDPFAPCDRRLGRLKRRICATTRAQSGGSTPDRRKQRSSNEHDHAQQGQIDQGRGQSIFDKLSSEPIFYPGQTNYIDNEKTGPLSDKVSGAFWAYPDISDPDFFDLQGFEWLRDVAARMETPDLSRSLINAWMIENSRYRPVTWAPALTATRLINIIHYNDYIFNKAGLLFRSRLLSSLARQARHLARTNTKLTSPIDRLIVPIAICLCGLAFSGHEALERQGRLLLKRELRLTVAADGSHASRNPSAQLRLVLLLIALREAYLQRGRQIPSFLKQEINRMLRIVDFFKDADGHLPVFNGGVEDDPKALATAMRQYQRRNTSVKSGMYLNAISEAPSEVLSGAPSGRPSGAIGTSIATGYQKLRSGRARVLVDVGVSRHALDIPATGKWMGAARAIERVQDKWIPAIRMKTQQHKGSEQIPASIQTGNALSGRGAYDSAASFQFSYAGQQIVTNCGTIISSNLAAMSRGPVTEEQAVFTQARAHSRLSIDLAYNSGDGADRRPPVFSYFEEDHGRLVEIDQAILVKSGVVKYKRRLFLDIDGHDFRGEEILAGPSCKTADNCLAIRFHLHPMVTACLSRDKRSVVITTSAQTGWRFSYNVGELSLEDSIHAAADGRHKRNKQIVLYPEASIFEDMPIKWRFSRQ